MSRVQSSLSRFLLGWILVAGSGCNPGESNQNAAENDNPFQANQPYSGAPVTTPAENPASTSPKEAPVELETSPTVAAPSQASSWFPVDLSPAANVEVEGLQGVSVGVQVLEGIEFRVQPRFLHLGSQVYEDYPLKLTGVPVGKHCQSLHFLLATQGGGFQQAGHPKQENDGVQVGHFVIHYVDGSSEKIPLIYGEDLRDWWSWDGDQPTKRARIALRGNSPQAARYNVNVRLYLRSWENPLPGLEITRIDFHSDNAKAAPFCVAISGLSVAE